MGQRRKRRYAWSEAELQLVRELYPILGVALSELLGRSIEALKVQARAEQVFSLARWTRKDEERLCELYTSHSNPKLAAMFDRDAASIMNKATLLGLRKAFPPGFGPWSKQDEQKLIDAYSVNSNRVLARMLGRDVRSITAKANYLRLKKDPDSDYQYPPELAEVIRLQRKIERKLNDREHDSDPPPAPIQATRSGQRHNETARRTAAQGDL